MKLRNKKTGDIVDYIKVIIGEFNGDELNTLAELNEEQEDYEKSKQYYYIEPNGVIQRIDEWDCCTPSDVEIMKSIGNYFETEEEAEQAVEKLKAWKRLKDKGFRFGGWTHTPLTHSITGYNLHIKAYTDELANYMEDLDLLFGGEE